MATGTSHAQWGWYPFGPQTLAEVEVRIARQFPDVPQWDPAALATSQHPPVVLDVREPEEHEVNHLSGAIRIGPNASLSDTARVLGGASILRFCSVGRRRSITANHIRAGLPADGASEVAILRGGNFARAIEESPTGQCERSNPADPRVRFELGEATTPVRTFVPE